MSFAKTHSGQSYCLKGQIIDMEVDLSRGLHSFSIVGLPDKAVEEAKDRISAAIKNSGFVSPKQKNHRVVISLAPADVKKEGSHFDLAMALGYLLASGDIDFDAANKIFVGELSLDGSLRKVHGVLSIVLEAKRVGFSEIYIPEENIFETILVENIKIFGVKNLQEVIEHLHPRGKKILETKEHANKIELENKPEKIDVKESVLDEIIGQPLAKRGLEIAAAGGHNILMSGPPGTGKTMLAHAFRSLLPPLTHEQSIEATSIHSASGLTFDIILRPPFRAPHHTTSYASLIGGGTIPQPGEITLAHHGVLFLDEFPEFDRRVIETLRQPLEQHTIHIARAGGKVSYPAHFILVAAMNPCPCGFNTSRKNICACAAADIAHYKKKISGPILDRIDLTVEVGDIEYSDFQKARTGREKNNPNVRAEIKHENQTSAAIKRISAARVAQKERFESLDRAQILNSEMTGNDLALLSNISPKAAATLLSGAESFRLSMRSYHRVWRVARTIADLDQAKEISESHVLEAFQFRRKSAE